MSRCTGKWGLLAALWLIAVPAFATDTVYYFMTDALHSTVVVTDQNRNIVEETHYGPYGLVLNRQLRDGPGYAGHTEDPATGLVYMQQRYYDPQAGRFLSTDPVQVSGGTINRYAYASDNPYRYTDPDGASPQGAWPLSTPCQPGPYCGHAGAQGLLTFTGNVVDVDNRSGLDGGMGNEESTASGGHSGPASGNSGSGPASTSGGRLGPYSSVDNAAEGGLGAAAPLGRKYEYDGAVIGTSKGYYATYPVTSKLRGHFSLTLTLMSGESLAAIYHTHPPGEYSFPDYFSRDDVNTARRLGVPSYIGVYDTHSIRIYNPNTMPAITRSIGEGMSLQGMSHGALLCANCFP